MLKIALTVSVNEQDHFLRKRYTKVPLKIAAEAGIPLMPVILPLTEDAALIRAYAEEFDGFIFTGGGDMDPQYFGEAAHPLCGRIAPERDAFEMALLAEVTALKKPVLGICRGMQVMNVFCGGSLWQDFASQLELTAPHFTKDENGSTHHAVTVSGWLRDLFGEERIMTNSYHHQSVKEPGKDLVICARSDDGIAEAMVHTALPYFRATQWHPEVDPDGYSAKIFTEFLQVCLSAST